MHNLTKLGIATILFLTCVIPGAHAKSKHRADPEILRAFATPELDLLAIEGIDLCSPIKKGPDPQACDPAVEVLVFLGDDALNLRQKSPSFLWADLPPNISPGSYPLLVIADSKRDLFARLDTTIGAVGPVGPAGPKGPPGTAIPGSCPSGQLVVGINTDGSIRCGCAGLDAGLGSATYYRDADGDTFGDTASSTVSCAPPNSYIRRPHDCLDSDPRVNPAQEGWFDSPRPDGSFDYNCDGAEQLRPDQPGVEYSHQPLLEECRTLREKVCTSYRERQNGERYCVSYYYHSSGCVSSLVGGDGDPAGDLCGDNFSYRICKKSYSDGNVFCRGPYTIAAQRECR